MKVKVIERRGDFLRLEIEGEGHTLCNLLQTLLLQDDRVEIAGYHKPHPLMDKTILYVRTKGGTSPEEALERAAERGRETAEEFYSLFEKEVASQKAS